MKIIFTLFFIFSACLVMAQSSTRDLEQYMQQVRQAPYQAIPESILTDTRNEARLINTIVPFLTDSMDVVRGKAYYIIKRIGQKSSNQTVRQQAVHQLVIGVRDPNSGNSGNNSDALTGFSKGDFLPVDRDSIGRYLRPQTPHLEVILKLAGYLELNAQQATVNRLLNSDLAFKYKWASRLALARMGEQNAISYILGKLNQAPVNDNLVYDVVPDLIYTRQKDIFKFLENIVNSDQPACQSADPDSNKKTICAYRVMEAMAPAIQNFPLIVDEFGNLETNDYQAALTTVRTWLAQNPNYILRKDNF
jgi:hypothetical protein